jgi:hypothetical protein
MYVCDCVNACVSATDFSEEECKDEKKKKKKKQNI